MRVLLDECLPRRLKADLPEHEVLTAQETGWAGMKNGELLRAASGRFDVFLTVDRKIVFQQNVKSLKIAVIVMVARSNRLVDLRPLIAQVREALQEVRAGEVITVGS
jgi:predicted nuclease of predicted toxin-antitoxin system